MNMVYLHFLPPALPLAYFYSFFRCHILKEVFVALIR